MLSKAIFNNFKYNKLYSTAKLRNTEFNKCNFKNLKLTNNPKTKLDKEEGYDFQETEISFPMMTEDPNNTYNNICVGYTKSITTNFASYDKKLHESYKLHVKNTSYSECDIFDDTIKYVKMIDSVIEKSDIGKVRIEQTDFIDSRLSEIKFNRTKFLEIKVDRCFIRDCNFNDIRFEYEYCSKFNDITFWNVKFTFSVFQATEFHNCKFFNCTFIETDFSQCVFDCEFFDCTFDSIRLRSCSTENTSILDFNKNKFKMLCDERCKFKELTITF